jgi:hypothetical protein
MTMQPRDLHPNRSLDKTWDLPSGADGRARSPAELLDNLRLRLSQLPDGHPSAARATSDIQPGRLTQDNNEDRSWQWPPRSAADGADDSGSLSAGGKLADLIKMVRDAGDGLAEWADGDVLADIERFPGDARYEPYRPWFMSAEPFTPWFAAGEDL